VTESIYLFAIRVSGTFPKSGAAMCESEHLTRTRSPGYYSKTQCYDRTSIQILRPHIQQVLETGNANDFWPNPGSDFKQCHYLRAAIAYTTN
jgi:hypothetical protein